MDPPLTFICTMRPKRPDFLATLSPAEADAMGEHMAYVGRLFDEGKVLIGGAATDGAIGFYVFLVDSAADAERIFEGDPAVRAGIGISELHPFRMGLLAAPLGAR
jgi:uncharacterized protein YciI